MKIVDFGLALLTIAVKAERDLTFTSNPSELLGGIHYWNCFTCGLAFDGVNKILRLGGLDRALHSFATNVCEFKDIVPMADEICP